jgi:hypothetical protein
MMDLECPLLGVERKSDCEGGKFVDDPFRTSSAQASAPVPDLVSKIDDAFLWPGGYRPVLTLSGLS